MDSDNVVKPRILLLEDDKHSAMLYEMELTSEGYDVVVAMDGRSAVHMALNPADGRKPDLLVFDIVIHGAAMDGLEAAGKIVGTKGYEKIPFILHSAYSSYRDIFMSWAADAFVVKCSDLDPLKKAIKKALGEYPR
ncbi:MAG: response regulator, partial [Candidatus Aenigmatarchaeota archaeon]